MSLPNGLDSRQVAERAQQRIPGLPVAFVTGYARVALPDDAAVVTKPIDPDALAACVHNAQGGRC